MRGSICGADFVTPTVSTPFSYNETIAQSGIIQTRFNPIYSLHLSICSMKL